MTRGTATVLREAAKDGGALIGYFPVGYPDLDTSIAAACAAADAGARIIELGLPYTDPVMDGPTIQAAAERALNLGTRPRDVLTAVERVAATGAAVLVMSYWNPILQYGVSEWSRDLAGAGGVGLITPDLIPDEAADWLAASDQYCLDRVFLVAPSSTDERLAMTAAACRGFVYAASTMGVTGARSAVGPRAHELVARTRAALPSGSDTGVCVGLGVSTPKQAAEVAGYADGVIVGSAFVAALRAASDEREGVTAVRTLAEALVAGIRGQGRDLA